MECAKEVQDYVLTPYVFAFGVEPLDVEDAHARTHAECRGRGWNLHLMPVTSPPGRTAFCIATVHAPSVGAALFALDEALDRFEHGRLRFLGQGAIGLGANPGTLRCRGRVYASGCGVWPRTPQPGGA